MNNPRHFQYNPWDFKKRFVFIEIVPPNPEDIARGVTKRELMKSIPDALKKMLTPEKLDVLRKTVGASGRRAAETAVRNLGSSVTEAQARVAAETAFRQAAAQEVNAAQTVARQAVTQAAEQVSVEAAKREAARQAGKSLAVRALPQAGRSLAVRTAATAAPEAAADLTPLAEAAGAGVGVTAAAVLAAVAGVALASWQGYELYSDIETSGWTTRGEQIGMAQRAAVEPWKVENIDSRKVAGKDRRGDLPEAAEQTGSWLRGAAKLGRDTSGALMVEARSFNDGAVDPEVSRVKINQMMDYADELSKRIEDLSHKPEIDPKSSVYMEAEASFALLKSAMEAAKEAMSQGKGSENLPKYKNALEYRTEATFRWEAVMIGNSIDSMQKTVNDAKGADAEAAKGISAKLSTAKEQLTGAENSEQLKPVRKLLDSMRGDVDKLILTQKEKLNTEGTRKLIFAFLRTKVPKEYQNNQEFMQRAMTICAAQLPESKGDEKKEGIPADAFLDRLNAVFPQEITPDAYAFQNDGYFKEDTIAEGPNKGRKRFEGYLWNPQSQAYVLGMIARCKSIPALASSQDAYFEELRKFMNNPKWQEKANNLWTEKGEAAFQSFIMQSLPTPEKYFGYSEEAEKKEKEEAAKEADKKAAKRKQAGGGQGRKGTAPGTGKVPGGPGKTPSAIPVASKAEKSGSKPTAGAAAPEATAQVTPPSTVPETAKVSETTEPTPADNFSTLPEPVRNGVQSRVATVVSGKGSIPGDLEKVLTTRAPEYKLPQGEYLTPEGVRIKYDGQKVSVTGVTDSVKDKNPDFVANKKLPIVDKSGKTVESKPA